MVPRVFNANHTDVGQCHWKKDCTSREAIMSFVQIQMVSSQVPLQHLGHMLVFEFVWFIIKGGE